VCVPRGGISLGTEIIFRPSYLSWIVLDLRLIKALVSGPTARGQWRASPTGTKSHPLVPVGGSNPD
jgi:hypothetical protein